jgi:archaellum component FlaC
MTDHELLEAMYKEICGTKTEMQGMKTEMQGMKTELQGMKSDIAELKVDVGVLKNKVTAIELKQENVTNHNIQLLAENHIELINKLNDAIHVQDKSLMFEVQISGLKMKIESLELEVQQLKSKSPQSA